MTPRAIATPEAAELLTGRSLRARYDRVVAAEFADQPLGPPTAPLTRDDLAPLPPPVRRYVERSGAIGRPRPQNMRVAFDAEMYRKPGQAPMRATSIQYSFFGSPARLFLMEARMFGLPVRALHVYRRQQATFTVRVASLVNMVDLRGDQMTAGETVTVLNDLCLMAPGALVDPRLAWEPLDDRTAAITFANGRHRVAAVLVFNDRDELVDFRSNDRPEAVGGRLVPGHWSTPVSEYRDTGGLHLAHRGSAVYARPDGPFTYGAFTLRSLAYDVPGPSAG
jgi:hypothetical protein